MQNFILKLKIFKTTKPPFLYDKEEITKRYPQIHSQRKGADSPGGFGFERAGKTNQRILSKIN